MKKLSRYYQFILESLILESNVIYSEKFRRALSKIGDDPIAKSLMGIENKDIDVLSNYFDIPPDKNDVVTFIPDKKAQEILGDKKELVKFTGRKGGWLTHNMEQNRDLFAALGYVPKGEAIFNPGNVDVGEVVSRVVSPVSGKTFVYVRFAKGEGVYNQTKIVAAGEDNRQLLWTKNRQEVRVGRAVRALLTANGITDFLDKDIELFVNKFRAIVDIMNDKFAYFEIVSGDALGYWYNKKNYLENKGVLGSSCQSVGRLDWLDIYIKNPDTVQLLILKSEKNPEKITGRALLWTLEDGSKMMDYIYYIKDSDRQLFMEYAKENGWFCRDKDNKTFVAYLKPGQTHDKYPSIDTMRYWDFNTGKISNRSFKGSKEICWSN
jgi:hypothetical protein